MLFGCSPELAFLTPPQSNTANSPATTSPASRLSPQRYLTRFLRRGREVESMQFTPGEKCKHVSKGALQELRKLREAMRSHNGEIQLALIIHRKPGPSVQLIPAGPVQPVPGTSAASVAGVNTRHLDPRKIQIASKQLHRIVCNAPSISCPCHLLHLRLGNKKGETPIVNPVGEARIEFSFVMTNDYHTCSNTEIPALDLAFTSQDLSRANNIHMETQLRPDTMLCKELLTSDDAYERYFCDPGSNQGCNPGFLLRRKIPQPISSTVISLDDVITTTKLYPFDQYLIAANLANSVLYHYSSPWIRNWTTKTILFFDRHAETAPLWMPHIPVHFTSNQDQLDFSDRNKELYVLGLILLQLGHGECAEPIHDESMMQRALSGLCMTLGRRYKQVVENFLRKGSDRSVDLMEVDNLEEFQAAIDMLKNLVDDHTPDIESSSVLVRGN